MPQYNIEVELAALNWSDTKTRLLGHCLVRASSPEKARDIINSIGPYKGRPNRVVPPFGCRAEPTLVSSTIATTTCQRQRRAVLFFMASRLFA